MYLFGKTKLSFSEGGTTFLETAMRLLVAVAAGGLLGWLPLARHLLPVLTRKDANRFLRNVGVSLLI